MKFIDVVNAFVYSNVYIALGAAGFAVMSLLFFGYDIVPLAVIVPFLLCFGMYTQNRKTDYEEDAINQPQRAWFYTKYGDAIYKISFIALFAAVVLSFLGNILAGLLAVGIIATGVFYNAPLIPKSVSKKVGFRRLKEVLFVKNLFVAIIWAIDTVLIPAAIVNMRFGQSIVFLAIGFVLLRILIGAIFFDLKDVKGDIKTGIKTLPTVLGVKNVIKILVVLNFLTLAFAPFFWQLNKLHYISTVIFAVSYDFLYLYLYRSVETKFLCNVMVDGEYIFLGLITVGTFLF